MANAGTSNYPVCAASANIDWTTAISDLTATAVTGAEALNLATYAGAALNIVRVGSNTTRCYVRARGQALTASTVSPVVQIWAGRTNPEVNGGLVPTTFGGLAGLDLWRVDTDDSDAAGITLTIPGTPSTSNMVQQTRSSILFRWTDTASNDGEGYDLRGADFVIVAHTTAGAVTATALIVEVGLLN